MWIIWCLLLGVVTATFAPSLQELRGPVYVAELRRCLPDDMYQLLNLTMETMKDMHPDQPAGTAYPVDKWAWYANLIIHHMKAGKTFCDAYARTTRVAVGKFSNHVFRGASHESYLGDCQSRLKTGYTAYAHHAARQHSSTPLTRANDPLVNCFTTAAKVARQTRSMESIHPEK
jgi:hypothetical protein